MLPHERVDAARVELDEKAALLDMLEIVFNALYTIKDNYYDSEETYDLLRFDALKRIENKLLELI